MGRAAAQLEVAGIPTVIIADRAFEQRLCAAFATFGLPSQATVPLYFPRELFSPEGSTASLEQGSLRLLSGLVELNPDYRRRGMSMEL